jgi:hypothetical protein
MIGFTVLSFLVPVCPVYVPKFTFRFENHANGKNRLTVSVWSDGPDPLVLTPPDVFFVDQNRAHPNDLFIIVEASYMTVQERFKIFMKYSG